MYKIEDLINKIHCCDCLDLMREMPENSIDCIITDPPYPKEFIDCYSILSEGAARVLKPGGYCIAYAGHMHLPEVYKRMSEHLEYYWTSALIHKGGGLTSNPSPSTILIAQVYDVLAITVCCGTLGFIPHYPFQGHHR